MQAEQLVQSVTNRTGIPHDEVRLVLDTVRDIVKEQLSLLEGVVLPGMLKIQAKCVKEAWIVTASPYKELANAVGTAVIKIT